MPDGKKEECGTKTVFQSIVGGRVCKLGNCPFLGLIGYQNEKNPGPILYGCGGSVINKHYLLTAAHCVDRRIRENAPFIVK